MKKLILLDFDGVLFNSKKNMEIAWNKVMKKFKIKKNFSHYEKFIGLPFKKILINLKIKSNHQQIENYYQINSIKYLEKIKPYKGVLQTLKKNDTRKYILGIWTSKHRIRVNKILKKYKLKFKIILTPSKKIKGKPHPDQIKLCSKRLKILRKNIVYVGDMNVDKIAARNSKIHFIFASYGFGVIKDKNITKLNQFNKIYSIVERF